MRYTYKDIEVMATALIMQQETDFEPSEATLSIAIIWIYCEYLQLLMSLY